MPTRPLRRAVRSLLKLIPHHRYSPEQHRSISNTMLLSSTSGPLAAEGAGGPGSASLLEQYNRLFCSPAHSGGLTHSNALAALALVDFNGQFLKVNPAFETLLGRTEKELQAQPFTQLVPKKSRDRYLEFLSRLSEGKTDPLRIESPVKKPDGSLLWADICLFVRGDLPALTFLIQAVPIGSSKPSRISRHASYQEIERSLEIRTAELKCASELLQQEMANREKLEEQIVQIAERERCRIGQDLHDGLGQELAGISLLGKTIADRLSSEGHSSGASAKQLSLFASQSIETAREIVRGLYPVVLARSGLLNALRDLALQCCKRYRIQCTVRSTGNTPELEKDLRIHAYRIAQEAISNAVKHGKATRIDLDLDSQNGRTSLTITDNGCGFRSSREPSAGMGLHLMAYRARILGAQFQAKEADKGGVCIHFRWKSTPSTPSTPPNSRIEPQALAHFHPFSDRK
jgi:PAS domain S-box-containing protein